MRSKAKSSDCYEQCEHKLSKIKCFGTWLILVANRDTCSQISKKAPMTLNLSTKNVSIKDLHQKYLNKISAAAEELWSTKSLMKY